MALPLNVSELDFFKIKTNLKTYLQSKPEFTDFDFDGAAISTLLDLLAYTTHYMGVHANMAFNEMFLDTAQLRSSVVSIVKELGYFPRQKQASIATVNISITNPAGAPASITIPIGTIFSGTADGASFQFVTRQTYVLTDNGSGVYAADINIVQGKEQQYRFVADGLTNAFILNQKGLDTDYMTVKVKNLATDPDSSATLYSRTLDFSALTDTNTVYFLEENSDGKVELYFGDGVIGKAIEAGNEIVVDTISTDGSLANLAGGFSLSSAIGAYSSNQFTITTVTKAAGGAEEESVASIKYVAPKFHEACGRAVTINDYRAILMSKYGWIQSLAIWGGEDNVPVQYGKVFIAIKPDYAETITSTLKQEVHDYLKKFTIVGILLEIVDADYVFVNVNSVVNYFPELTTKPQADIEGVIDTTISAFFTDIVSSNFESQLIQSKIITAIDAADYAIRDNETHFTLSKKLIPTAIGEIRYALVFDNELEPGSLLCTYTNSQGTPVTIKDDSAGNLVFYTKGTLDSTKTGHTINYATGAIDFGPVNFGAVSGTVLEFVATPVSMNVKAAQNRILVEGTRTISANAVVA